MRRKEPISIRNESYEEIELQRLKSFPGNARKGDVDALAEAIKLNGFYGSLIVNTEPGSTYGDYTVLAGNHRLFAAQKLGMTKIPCTLVAVTDQVALQINITDNRISDLAETDERQLFQQLADMVQRQEGDVLAQMGIGQEYLTYLAIQAEEKTPEPPKPKSEPKKTRILVQCTCDNCNNTWTGYIDEDANIQKVSQPKGRKTE